MAEAFPNCWVDSRKPNPRARVQLFCLPYAGAGAQAFFSWRMPSDDVEFLPVEIPGRGKRIREDLQHRLTPLAQAAAKGITPHVRTEFALFGHSMGALLVFEIARELRRLGGPQPRHLFLSACHAPHLECPGPRVHDLPEHEFVRQLVELKRISPEATDSPELLEFVLPILRADLTLVETYAYTDEPPLSCPMTVFGGTTDGEVTREELDAWRTQTSGPLSYHEFPGDHLFIHEHSLSLLNIVSAELK